MFLGRHRGTDLDTEKKDQKPRWSCRNHVEIMSKSCRNHAYEGLIHDFDHPYSVQLGWDPKMFSSTETWSTLGSGKLMVFDGFSGIGLIVDGCC